VEEITISYTTNFITCLDELVFVLYNENYFSYIENAYDYTSKIYDFIDYSLATFPRKNTPKSLSKYGDYYVFYKSNAKKQNVFLIKHITNNHSFDSKLFNE
jgi:hypothetical protein